MSGAWTVVTIVVGLLCYALGFAMGGAQERVRRVHRDIVDLAGRREFR